MEFNGKYCKKKYVHFVVYIKVEKVIILLSLNFFTSETIPAMPNQTGIFIRNLQKTHISIGLKKKVSAGHSILRRQKVSKPIKASACTSFTGIKLNS